MDKIHDWGVYKCGACGHLEIGGLLGFVDSGPKKDSRCRPNCDAQCTDLKRVSYTLTEVT